MNKKYKHLELRYEQLDREYDKIKMGSFAKSCWLAYCIAMFVVSTFICIMEYQNTNELGEAICKEKYNTTFVSYFHGDDLLICQSEEDYSMYDGIKIKLGAVE
jgi:hypothetical protein